MNDSVVLAHWHSNSWGGAEYLITKLAVALDIESVYTIGQPEPDTSNPYGDINWIDVANGPVDSIKKNLGRAAEYALWEDVDWREFGDPDILLTSGSTTRSVITPDDTLHINYCHSPPRWLYDLYHDRKSSLLGTVARPAVRYFRLRDQAIDPRVDTYLANSPIIQRRLWKYYKRDATVLYPPVELESYYHEPHEHFYLHLGRLDNEKGVPAIVSAFENRNEHLLFAGGRGDVTDDIIDRIEQASNMEYLGFVDEARKYELLATCRAVVFNGINEDFGIVPIEANASGKPCLVRNDGFPDVFVEDGHNGLIHDGTADGIGRVLDRVGELDSETVNYQSLVEPFSMDVFEHRLRRILDEELRQFRERFDAPDHESYT